MFGNKGLITKELSFYVPLSHNGLRLDVCVSNLIKGCSRSYLAHLVRGGSIYVDNRKNKKPGYKVKTGERIKIFPYIEEKNPAINAEPIPLKIVYEDDYILVINKDAGIVVHPSPGHSSGTLVNGILYHYKRLLKCVPSVTRPGIIHRLDKDTTGLIVVAKNRQALANISDQFKQRTVNKQYIAIVYGNPKSKSGQIDLPIGRHRIDRKKMSTYSHNPRSAKTLWNKLESYKTTASLLKFIIETGRTHQIRVHCKAIGHPILGDQLYKNKGQKREFLKEREDMIRLINKTNRQMLHAYKIRLKHPKNKLRLEFKAELPKDMVNLIDKLRSGNFIPNLLMS